MMKRSDQDAAESIPYLLTMYAVFAIGGLVMTRTKLWLGVGIVVIGVALGLMISV
jgi:hypothetical protein